MSYAVKVTREDGAWLADVPELPGTHTWARNLVALESDVREAIALSLDIPESETAAIALDLQFESQDAGVAQSALIRELRAQQQELEERIARESRKLIPLLNGSGYSVRDISVLLAISPGRVSQLAPQVTAGRGDQNQPAARPANVKLKSRTLTSVSKTGRKGTSVARSAATGKYRGGAVARRHPDSTVD